MAKVKERRLFVNLFKTFIQSITPRLPKKRTLVGEDYLGTKYYELEHRESIHNKPNRYFVPKVKDDFEQELPAEWESWLRNRRKTPPTEEEVNANYEISKLKKVNAAKLEAQFPKETNALDMVNPDDKPLEQHASLGFPAYDEYKRFGRDYKPNWKKPE